eukprot:scaffold120954_cov24-Tisochrysis_lutea.AAC.2
MDESKLGCQECPAFQVPGTGCHTRALSQQRHPSAPERAAAHGRSAGATPPVHATNAALGALGMHAWSARTLIQKPAS